MANVFHVARYGRLTIDKYLFFFSDESFYDAENSRTKYVLMKRVKETTFLNFIPCVKDTYTEFINLS